MREFSGLKAVAAARIISFIHLVLAEPARLPALKHPDRSVQPRAPHTTPASPHTRNGFSRKHNTFIWPRGGWLKMF